MRTFVMQSQARQLLHNKFVVVLGGSVQRSMYKDLVLLLQRDQYLTLPQLKSKGEYSFEQDILVEGGRLGPMTNGTEYKEVRQYRSDHLLLRFYFLTRIYSPYMESILEDLKQGPKPDVVIIGSCVWDITRYGLESLDQYKENLHKFFGEIKTIVHCKCLILWVLAMPVGKKIKGGFLVPEVSHLAATLRYDVIEANFYSGRLAEAYGFDVLDLHFHFRLSLQHRMPDGIHWDALAHRRVSSLLLQHTADAWGVHLDDPPPPPGQVFQDYRGDFGHHDIRPEWPCLRPILDSAPLQRRGPVPYQESHRSDRLQLFPPNSDRAVNIRPPLAPTWLANQPAQTADLHYRAVDPLMHYLQQPHLYRQQNSAAAGVRPPRGRGFAAAAGNWRLCSPNYNPLPPDNLWPEHLQVRDTCSQMDSMFSAAVDPLMHYLQQPHLYRPQNSAAAGVRPPRGRGFAAAAGSWGLCSPNYNPLPSDNLWPEQQDYPQVRDTCSQMDSMFSAGGGFRVRPHFQADDLCMRRRRTTNFRTHPYPSHHPRVTPYV
ncbi:PC-esterase domain-containing protein 1A-like isoform X1 [Sebastes umbrosus]|uniref:PC-esterase domain-containing protein 1A-like isoform X1 n=1 Tax=Sebastes umbrosus TaxID=72105 RepID=UPI00189D9DE5|nr:PC-esterase domain-containing protein 1A-like isoform X1 [Sebastes umbrosus]